MDFDYVITDEFLDLVKEQIWETKYGLRIYKKLMLHEFAHYSPFLPERPKCVLDMCSGLGRTAICLKHHYRDQRVDFWLADRQGRTKNTGDFNPPQDEYYNDFGLTEQFCLANGFNRGDFMMFDTERGFWPTLPKFDLIISTVGLGFHVPIERYIDRLISAATKDCTMIFGCRMDKYDAASFEDLFEESMLIPSKPRHPCPYEEWLVLRRPK